MLAPAETSASQRVRCRQIAESDLDALAGLLLQGFPSTSRPFWEAGLARMAALSPVEGTPRFGYVLESERGLVGALLAISSRRGQQVFSNVSAWYVHPSYRAHSTLLVSTTTKHKHVVYVNTSPADHTLRTLQLLGWERYNFGRSAAFPLPGFGRGLVGEDIPADLPERTLLEDHRLMGCISVVCKKGATISPFVFKRRWVGRLNVPVMELIWCRATSDFERCAPALWRHFLKRRAVGFTLDGKVRGMLSRYIDDKEPRLYKGPHAPMLNDLAYTEKVIFG
jgi:hypothetical protein